MSKKILALCAKTYKQSVREVNGMTIFFRDKESVWIQYGKGVVVVHRWDDKTRGRYSSAWRPFQQKLKTAKIETIYDIIKYANLYDIGFVYSDRPMPEIPNSIKRY